MPSALSALAAAGLCAALLVGKPVHGDSLLEQLESYSLVHDALPVHRSLRSAKDEMVYSFTAFGEVHEVELKLKRNLFAPGFEHRLLKADGSSETMAFETDCIYESKSSKSKAVFSFCGEQVHGRVLKADGEHLHIAPLPSDASQHIAYRMRDLKQTEGRCGITESNMRQMTVPSSLKTSSHLNGAVVSMDGESTHQHRTLAQGEGAVQTLASEMATNDHPLSGMAPPRRSLVNENVLERVVEVLLVNDYEVYQKHGNNVQVFASYITSLVNSMYGDFPGTYSVEVVLTGMVTFSTPSVSLTGVNHPTYTDKVNPSLSLGKFSLWVEEQDDPASYVGSIDFDVAHMLVGTDFHSSDPNGDGVVGLAWLDGWCEEESTSPAYKKTAITQATFDSAQYIANIMTHEIGHNLGFQHTDVSVGPFGSGCFDPNKAQIMDPITNKDPVWSACSQEHLRSGIQSDFKGDCTVGLSTLYTSPQFGNGILEAGEECDCLLFDCATHNPCCECTGGECALKAGSECSSNDACCNTSNCTIRSAFEEFVCRGARDGTCDTAEKCQGDATCPVDIVSPTGTDCDGGTGTCYFGACRSIGLQCAEVGYDSAASPAVCNELRCRNDDTAANSYFPVAGYSVWDGAKCGSSPKSVCYQGSCTSDLGSLPLPVDLLNCTNNVKDGSETDIDCGGDVCLPCYAGKVCNVNEDCLFPAVCNATTSRCDASRGSGTRQPIVPDTPGGLLPDDLLALWDKILPWMKENPIAAGGIGAGVLLLLVLCCWPMCCASKAKERRRRVVRRVPMARVAQPQEVYVPAK